jgi:RES domain-containing protein
MILWRISKFADLSGKGGELVSGRWHLKGHAIVYCADHPSTALLEMIVHLNPANIPDKYQLLKISCPESVFEKLGYLTPSEEKLSGDEAELLELVVGGRAPEDVSAVLGVSAEVVEQHLTLADLKLNSIGRDALDEFVQSTLRMRIDDPDFTVSLGMKWLTSRSSSVLKVPSAVMPAATNYLLNPKHPDAEQIEIVDIFEYPFDRRLK